MPAPGKEVKVVDPRDDAGAADDGDDAESDGSADAPSERDLKMGVQTVRLHQIKRRASAARLTTEGTALTEMEKDELDDMAAGERWCPMLAELGSSHKEKRGCCYWLFLLVFAGFLVIFPLFLIWLVTSPMPSQYWNEEFDPFPALEDVQFIKDQTGGNFNITLSDIPQTWHGCNHTCIGTSTPGSTSETSFPVDMALSAPDFEYTAFPVLLASNDFHTWWVASDRNDTRTSPFFPSHEQEYSDIYRLTTDQCTRAPDVAESAFKSGASTVSADDGFGSVPIYAMVCVAWDFEDVVWHSENMQMSKQDVAERCQAVGGLCGWPCGSNPVSGDLAGCSAGAMDVDVDGNTLAGVTLDGANFSGDVTLRACFGGTGQKQCTTTNAPMSEWACHKCAINVVVYDLPIDPSDPTKLDNRTVQVRYDSLPAMEVVLDNVALTSTDAVPRAFLLTSTVDSQGRGPAGLFDGQWTKLYFDTNFVVSDPKWNPMAVPVSALESAEVESEAFLGLATGIPSQITQDDVEKLPMLLDVDKQKMEYVDQSKVILQPEACFASRGPLYLVACAVNESTYQDSFQFTRGQEVAPPPFNDRCLTVVGRCAYACMSQQTPGLEYCDSMNYIHQSELWQDFELPTNDIEIVYIFMFSLMFGFAVKLMTYFPGLFTADRHPPHYNAGQTEVFKYIAVCTPSGGESKACVLRNLVGAIAALPAKCKCPYHVVYADEGHRHPHKMMFRAFVAVCHAVPDTYVATGDKMEPSGHRGRRRGGSNLKEDNLKAFTKTWTEQSRTYTLKDCETGKMQESIDKLKESGEGAQEIKELNRKIDVLCGLSALRRLQDRQGWQQAVEIKTLEDAIMRLRAELAAGEKDVAKFDEDAEKVLAPGEATQTPKAMYLDDCEAFTWPDDLTAHAADSQMTGESPQSPGEDSSGPRQLYTLHYVARAKPDEDERTLKVQHVARGSWYYRIHKEENIRNQRSWLHWREECQVYQDGDTNNNFYVVPLRTSRGKAGGLNFCENYLFEWTRDKEEERETRDAMNPVFKHALFSIADARHQFQTDFFHETIPHFFKYGRRNELDVRVAFTQSPQYFPEMPDETDYLDTNNANFFRLNCMLRNCCGGVSSCGTNGTWMVRDRRTKRNDNMWELAVTPRMEFLEKVEARFFHESCKVEDTASSLDRVVAGKFSRYVNRRLSYGMAKDPVDYLAAVQRWAEGGVVLSLQTFLSCGEGIHMIWMSLFLFVGFVTSLVYMIFGPGYQDIWREISQTLTPSGDYLRDYYERFANECADLFVENGVAEVWSREVYFNMVMEVEIWLTLLFAFVFCLAILTYISHYLHHMPCSCETKKKLRRTRFPTSLAQWARLFITLDNLTYFCWFWTAYFWVGFNYYGLWGRRFYHFEAGGMVLFSYLLQALGWSLVITASFRYRSEQGSSANEVFFLSLTNVWRTTQLFYISAPLVTYSLIMGCSDFLRNRMLGVDISYWVGGDRGAVSKSIAQWWVLLLIIGAIVSHIFYWAGWLPYAEIGSLLIVSFIALDVMHPCAFLWLGTEPEKLPKPPTEEMPKWQRIPLRFLQLAFSLALYRNFLRKLVFHPRSAAVVKWIGPTQNVLFPFLTFFIPELGVNQALLLLASART